MIGYPLHVGAGINLLILLVLIWILYRVIEDEGNLIIWSDFIASMGLDCKQHGDLNKLGQLAGIFLAVQSVLMYANGDKADGVGLAAVLGVSLAYLGGVSAYAASLRSKRERATVTTVTEPAPDPSVTKTTVTETHPEERR